MLCVVNLFQGSLPREAFHAPFSNNSGTCKFKQLSRPENKTLLLDINGIMDAADRRLLVLELSCRAQGVPESCHGRSTNRY
jgi:hypothetical protein